jgi:chemotaxis protein methyltransferase CheR
VQICGIVLDESKGYLAESRLGLLTVELGCDSYRALLAKTQIDKNIQARVIDAICTNETSFFRDSTPFNLFQYKILPDHIDRQNGQFKKLNIWSAASSTAMSGASKTNCALLPVFKN